MHYVGYYIKHFICIIWFKYVPVTSCFIPKLNDLNKKDHLFCSWNLHRVLIHPEWTYLKSEESAFKVGHWHAGKLLLAKGQDQEPYFLFMWVSPSGLGFLTAQWLDFKIKHSKTEPAGSRVTFYDLPQKAHSTTSIIVYWLKQL
jgi:hypothetical protein